MAVVDGHIKASLNCVSAWIDATAAVKDIAATIFRRGMNGVGVHFSDSVPLLILIYRPDTITQKIGQKYLCDNLNKQGFLFFSLTK